MLIPSQAQSRAASRASHFIGDASGTGGRAPKQEKPRKEKRKEKAPRDRKEKDGMLPNLKPSTPRGPRLFPNLAGEIDDAAVDNGRENGRDSALGWSNGALDWDRSERAAEGADQERSHRERDRDRDRDRDRHERDPSETSERHRKDSKGSEYSFYPQIPQSRAGGMSGMAPPIPPQRAGYKMESKPKKKSKAKKASGFPPAAANKRALPNMGMSVVSSNNYGTRNAPMSISGNNYGAPPIVKSTQDEGGFHTKPAKKKPPQGYNSSHLRGGY
jgi:hypothetical protein